MGFIALLLIANKLKKDDASFGLHLLNRASKNIIEQKGIQHATQTTVTKKVTLVRRMLSRANNSPPGTVVV